MAKTLLAVGAWMQCANLVVFATGSGWRVLHTSRLDDTQSSVLKPAVDLIVIVASASPGEWEVNAATIRTLSRSAPVLTIGSADNQELLREILAASTVPPTRQHNHQSLCRYDPDAAPTVSYEASQLSPTLTLFESAHAAHCSGIPAALAFIEARYADAITLDDAAQAAFYSRCHFCRIFKEKTGRSFVAFLSEVRIGHAVELLSRSDMSITDIGFAVGFNDLSHFERVFRSLRKQSPKQYRQSAKHSLHTEQDLRSGTGGNAASL